MSVLSTEIEYAKKLDKEDPLAEYRDRFYIPQHKNKDSVYLCGNSLGLQPKTVRKYIEEELKSWEVNGVEGHFKDTKWVSYHESISEDMCKIVGAKKNEVVVMNTLTTNLHLLMVSFYRPTKQRYKILIEGHAFPSDQYAVKSQIAFHGFDPNEALIELKPSIKTGVISDNEIRKTIETEGEKIALILIGGVNYYSGQVFDMKKITELGHSKGCIVGFDLAHGVGNIELNLHDWDVDFAVWCTYKYLNSSPGAIAGCYVNEKYGKDNTLPRFEGWWGVKQAKRFLMKPKFEPTGDVQAWQLSNPPILSMTPIKASLEIFKEIDINELRKKSIKLTNYLESLIQSLKSENLWISPSKKIRGCQISLHVKKGGKVLYDKLTKDGVICDWREPDVIRLAPVPLYNSFMDVHRFYEILKKNLE